jgi:hypothetical protein
MKQIRRADIFSDESVAIIRDTPALKMAVHKDDAGNAEESIILDEAQFESLTRQGAANVRFDRSKNKFAIWKNEPDTKGKDNK